VSAYSVYAKFEAAVAGNSEVSHLAGHPLPIHPHLVGCGTSSALPLLFTHSLNFTYVDGNDV